MSTHHFGLDKVDHALQLVAEKSTTAQST